MQPAWPHGKRMARDVAEAADAVSECKLSDDRAETLEIESSVDGSHRVSCK